MLYREPKLLKVDVTAQDQLRVGRVSVLYREPKLLKVVVRSAGTGLGYVSVLYREPKLLKDEKA